MNPNLVTPAPFSYKDLLLKKLYYAVLCSVFSQLMILVLFLLALNFNIIHPVEWFMSTLRTLTSFSTWLYIIPFVSIIFAQSIICAKDYVFKSTYCSTRFQKFISMFSVHNLVLLILHVLVGGILVWMFLSLSGSKYQYMTKEVKKNHWAVIEGTFYLIMGGLWTGLYFFSKIYISEKHLLFPVIQQRKILQFKSSVLPLLKESFMIAIWPTIYFDLMYYFWGDQTINRFQNLIGSLDKLPNEGYMIYLYAWLFTTLYCFSMNLMRFFFNLFLTEPVEFPLIKQNEECLTLQNGINMSNLPIVQSLACLDLYLLAQWSQMRRQVFYSLSLPGGHPHNWNYLVENVLKLFSEYTELLNKSTENLSNDNVLNKTSVCNPTITPSNILSPTKIDRFRNFRNMSLLNDSGMVDIVDISHNHLPGLDIPDSIFTKLKAKIAHMFSVIKVVLGINFVFGELPQANIQKCLGNGHLIIWTSQGISDLTCLSLVEDRYGIVQKDLPVIITTLVNLKQSLDRLNKVPALTRKIAGYDDFNYKMKGAVTVAVKRSLFNICRTFEEYLGDFPLSKDVMQHLQTFVLCKN